VLAAANPRLVLLSITGFGQSGSSAGRQAYAPVIHAESGLIGRQSSFDAGWPTDPMLSIADTNAGLHGTIAVLAALHLRDATGTGQHIDMAMFDAMVATDDYAHHAIDGFPIRRLGGEIWAAPGGSLLVAGEFRHVWRQVSTVHGVAAHTPDDVDFDTKVAVRRAAFATWLLAFPDRSAACAAIELADLAWADVRPPMQVFEAVTATERGVVATIDDRGGGQRGVVQSPYRFSAATSGVTGPAPYRGEHNTAVLRDWLGMASADIDALTRDGLLQAEALPGV
jgi:CoA:oxalate CoA-transferase